MERILAIATTLIAEAGSDALRMGEVAAKAEVSIGSLYQYFPDKSALIGALAERYNAESRAAIQSAMAPVATMARFNDAFGDLIDASYARFRAEPVRRDVWAATQADPRLRQAQLAESRAQAALLTAVMARLNPGAERKTLDAAALLLLQLSEATLRLAVSVPRAEGDRLVAALKRLILR